MAARRLIVRDCVTGKKFLVDIRMDVSTIPVPRRDRTHISDRVLYAVNERIHGLFLRMDILRIDKNYSSLIWDSVMFFNGLS